MVLDYGYIFKIKSNSKLQTINLFCIIKKERKKLHIPANPSLLAAWYAVLPFSLFNFDTTVSAGWETTAQKIPAEIKEKNI